MNLYTISLFLHVVGAIGVFVVLGFEWMSLRMLQRATTVGQIRQTLGAGRALRGLGGISMLVLLIAGIYMMATAWGGVAWATVGFGAMVLLAVLGAVLTGPRMRAIGRALAAQPTEDGPITSELRQLLEQPLLLLSLLTRIAIALGIVFLMTVKPALTGSLVAIGIAALLGVALSLPAFMRAPAQPLAAAPGESGNLH